MPVANSDNRLRLVSDSEAHLRSIIATLEENRAALVESSNLEAAQILAVQFFSSGCGFTASTVPN